MSPGSFLAIMDFQVRVVFAVTEAKGSGGAFLALHPILCIAVASLMAMAWDLGDAACWGCGSCVTSVGPARGWHCGG